MKHDATTETVEGAEPACNGERVERAAWLMGTTLTARVCADSEEAAVDVIEAAFRAVREVEARLSTWRPDSELSRLNAAPPGTWVGLSRSTAELLREARMLVAATGGAFDPAAGAAIDAWDLRGEGRVPSPADMRDARRSAGLSGWEIDASRSRARRMEGVRLDAGAFGKGAGLRVASEALDDERVEWSFIDFGGQLLLTSRDPAARWRVAVADPADRSRAAATMSLGPGSVATTAASERYVETGGERAGHVIDPRTARPVDAWGSVTVVTDDPVLADALSTALFVMTPAAGLDWARSADVAALFLENGECGPTVRGTHAMPDVSPVTKITCARMSQQ